MVKKKIFTVQLKEKRLLIDGNHPKISVRRQCELIGLNRSGLYYEPATESELNLTLMHLIDEQYTGTPFYGYPRMTEFLMRKGFVINHEPIPKIK